MATAKKARQFNAFGLVTIQKHVVMATLTTIIGERSITRTVKDEDVTIHEVKEKESVVVTLGVLMEKAGTRVTAHEIGTEGLEGLMIEIPQVSKVVSKVINMIKQTAEI